MSNDEEKRKLLGIGKKLGAASERSPSDKSQNNPNQHTAAQGRQERPDQGQFGQRQPGQVQSGHGQANHGQATGQAAGQTMAFTRTKSAHIGTNTSKPVSPGRALEPGDVAVPPKRSRHARNRFVVFFNFLMSSAVFSTLVLLATIYFGNTRFQELGPLDVTRTIVIKEGQALSTISSQLMSRGIIDNDLIFRLGVRAHRAQAQMQAGEYVFKPQMSMYEVMQTLRLGRGVVHKISIPEGLTTFQIMQRIEKNGILIGEMPEFMPAEGSLMPDTYPFQRGLTRKELISEMMRVQKRFLQEVWQRRVPDLPITTPQEMVILASIVEKETGKADERPHVASVFVNRLNKGMKLQSDPTIIYGLFGGQGKPKDRPIYRSDINKATPYNTYTIKALPPGPISNPGRASLEAVANPSKTGDLFFVADGTGGHVFAVTLKEHNANVARWRTLQKRLKKEAGERAKKEAAEQSADTNGQSQAGQ